MNDGNEILTEAEAATVLKLKASTLGNLRRKGKGPPYSRIGGSIRYVRGDLIDWVRTQRRRRQ